MPDGPSLSRPRVPIPATDRLFVLTLRAALSCYERGDYLRAAHYFQDAAAVGGARPEAMAWVALGDAIHGYLHDGTLVSRDAAEPREHAVRP